VSAAAAAAAAMTKTSIVVGASVLAGKLSLSCARLMDGRLTTLWVKRPLSVNQQGQLSLPSLRGQLNE